MNHKFRQVDIEEPDGTVWHFPVGADPVTGDPTIDERMVDKETCGKSIMQQMEDMRN